MYRSAKTTELQALSVTDETVSSVLGTANTVFIPISQHNTPSFVKIVSANDDNWVQDGAYYKYTVLLSEHRILKVSDIIVNKKLDECYENIIFSYKKYLTGSVGIILSEPSNIEIIIKGE